MRASADDQRVFTVTRAAAIILAALWWSGAWFAVGRVPVPAFATESLFAPFVDIQGTHLAGTDSAGRRQWELEARSVQLDKSRSLIVLQDVTGSLFHEGKQVVQLIAPRATYSSKSNTVELSGGVVGTVVDGRKLEAQTIRWVTGAQLTASGNIVLVQSGLTIRADSLHADSGLQEVTFEGHVAIAAAP